MSGYPLGGNVSDGGASRGDLRSSVDRLPARIEVASVVSARYGDAEGRDAVASSQWHTPGLDRPLDWDSRVAGNDVVTTTSGQQVTLRSTGMQSVPQPGWVLMLTSGTPVDGYEWTLYGLPSAK